MATERQELEAVLCNTANASRHPNNSLVTILRSELETLRDAAQKHFHTLPKTVTRYRLTYAGSDFGSAFHGEETYNTADEVADAIPRKIRIGCTDLCIQKITEPA